VSLILDEHREYLSDPHRLAAFERAITATVRSGDVVIDLGAGTGILGLLACRAGAARVYVIDQGGIIELARELYRANGFADRVVCVKGVSTRVSLPERADVVVADQIGRFGFEAGVWEYFSDARARLLKPGASSIPCAVELWTAPVEAPSLRKHVDFWREERPAGFDVSPARLIAVNTGYPATLAPEQLLGEATKLVTLDLRDAPPGSVTAETTTTIARAGHLHGLGGWFRAELAPGIFMSNAPGDPARIARRNVFLPLERPVLADPGDLVRVAVRVRPADVLLRWSVTVETKSGAVKATCSQSTAAGMLLAREDLERTRPDYVPRLTSWGEARRTLLELCDGHRTLGEIESELCRRHPRLFASPAAASGFVAEVVTRYA
jgi:protein arginine N-methyltransferase 1